MLTRCAKVNSPDAFGPKMIQRELARRDLIRDEIAVLSEDQQQATSHAEAARQQRWEELRKAHKTKWQAGALETRPGAQSSGSVAEPLSDGRTENNVLKTSLKDIWRSRKIGVTIPLRYLRKGWKVGDI